MDDLHRLRAIICSQWPDSSNNYIFSQKKFYRKFTCFGYIFTVIVHQKHILAPYFVVFVIVLDSYQDAFYHSNNVLEAVEQDSYGKINIFTKKLEL